MAHGTCCRCVQKRHFWAYGWTWRRNVALVRLVGVCGRGVAESTLALRLREEKRHGWVDVCMGYLIFFQPRRTKLTKSIHCAGETQFLTLESHACQSNVHVANIVWQVPQIPAFRLLASKISTSNLSPSQGRRVNWLPCFTCTKPTHQISVKNHHQITHHLIYVYSCCWNRRSNHLEAGPRLPRRTACLRCSWSSPKCYAALLRSLVNTQRLCGAPGRSMAKLGIETRGWWVVDGWTCLYMFDMFFK